MIKLVILAAAAAGAFAAAKASSEEKKNAKKFNSEPQHDEAVFNDPKAKEYDMDYMYI